jgi:hypothetical protein
LTAAVAAYDSLAADPHSLEHHLKLGQALMGAGDHRRALQHFQRAWTLAGTAGSATSGIPPPSRPPGSVTSAAEPFLRAMLARFYTKEMLRNDPNFLRFRELPGFKALVQ